MKHKTVGLDEVVDDTIVMSVVGVIGFLAAFAIMTWPETIITSLIFASCFFVFFIVLWWFVAFFSHVQIRWLK